MWPGDLADLSGPVYRNVDRVRTADRACTANSRMAGVRRKLDEARVMRAMSGEVACAVRFAGDIGQRGALHERFLVVVGDEERSGRGGTVRRSVRRGRERAHSTEVESNSRSWSTLVGVTWPSARSRRAISCPGRTESFVPARLSGR